MQVFLEPNSAFCCLFAQPASAISATEAQRLQRATHTCAALGRSDKWGVPVSTLCHLHPSVLSVSISVEELHDDDDRLLVSTLMQMLIAGFPVTDQK